MPGLRSASVVIRQPKESGRSLAPTTATVRRLEHPAAAAVGRAARSCVPAPAEVLTDCSVYDRATVRDKDSTRGFEEPMAVKQQGGEAVADVRRDQMLVAAAHLIAERGFSDTRIADVAERVGASPALVIYYFGTKDSLLTEALRWSERSFYAAVEEMLQGTPKLRARIENLVDCPASRRAQDVPDDWGLWFDLWAQAFRHPEVRRTAPRSTSSGAT